MIKHRFKGKLIVFEGIDGAGSTTQVNLFCEYLQKNKIKFLKSAEPTDGPIGKIIRQVLRGDFEVDSQTLQLMYIADRSDHLSREVIPALKRGEIVVLDRYALSTFAYGLLNLDGVWLLEVSKNFILPDITFLVDTPTKVAMQRMSKRTKKELFEKEKFLRKVERNYKDLAMDFGKEIVVLDGRNSKEKVFDEIIRVLKRRRII